MAIFHLKHSYLNWRANPCRRKRLQFFIFFQNFFEFGFLDFRLDSIELFKCMTWQSIFLFSFFFFFRSHDPSTSGNDACHRWSSRLKHHSSCENYFEKGVVFWFMGRSRHFCPKKGYGSKDFPLCHQGKGLWFKGLLIPFYVSKKRLWLEGFPRNEPSSINMP